MQRQLFLFALLLWGCINPVFSQTEVDSLWGVWYNERLLPVDRVSALRTLVSKKYSGSDIDSTRLLIVWQLDFAREYRLDREEAYALLQLGGVERMQGRYDVADSLADITLDRFQAVDESEGILKVYYFKGALASRRGNFRKAIDHYQRSIDMAESLADSARAGEAMAGIGLAYRGMGSYDEALRWLRQSARWMEGTANLNSLANLYNSFGAVYYGKSIMDSTVVFFEKSMAIFDSLGNEPKVGMTANNIAVIQTHLKNYDEALRCYGIALEIQERFDDKNTMASTLSNMAVVANVQGRVMESLRLRQRSLAISEEIGDMPGIASSTQLMGIMLNRQGETEVAKEYLSRSLEISLSIEDKEGYAGTQHVLGQIYYEEGDWDEAERRYQMAHQLYQEMGNAWDASYVQMSQAELNLALGELDAAEILAQEALTIITSHGMPGEGTKALLILGQIYQAMGQYTKALEIANQGMEEARISGSLKGIKEVAELQYLLNKQLGNTEASFAAYELFIEMRDSIKNEEFRKEMLREEYEQQAKLDSVRYAEEIMLQEAKMDALGFQQKLQQAYLWGGSAIVVIVGLMGIQRYRNTRREKDLVEEQKLRVDDAYHRLADRNREVLDSITYAKRIQGAILPPESTINSVFPQSFVLYKPKDIVAGDFYWVQRKNDFTYVAVADCTGHGVPGAMVSVVCQHSLNRALHEYKRELPGEILDVSRDLVLEELKSPDLQVSDGMDLALCALKGNKVWFAGAYNPLWLVREGNDEAAVLQEIPGAKVEVLGGYTFVELKADRQPVGRFPKYQAFTTHTLTLKPKDTLYMFTDGYPDQFGGAEGKKYQKRNLRRLLVSLQGETMLQQKMELEKALKQWQGDAYDQVDDICVMGIRV
ncbi:MAG TPA: hypothetical protein DCE41_23620 [Cytophagales bacterium]|nr:hypothetical protein [Cytophagales bacterium]HAA19198.1 hypothetical protein [Cytophagales bacterium]HAP64051.1 hypothetical protein [Cytophagales bacterium]